MWHGIALDLPSVFMCCCFFVPVPYRRYYTCGQKVGQWHRYCLSQSWLLHVVWCQPAYTPECYEGSSDILQLLAKSLCKSFPLHSALPQNDQLCQWFLSLTQVSVAQDEAGEKTRWALPSVLRSWVGLLLRRGSGLAGCGLQVNWQRLGHIADVKQGSMLKCL